MDTSPLPSETNQPTIPEPVLLTKESSSSPGKEVGVKKKVRLGIVLGILLTLLLVLSVVTYLFFTHNSFRAQRAIWFKNIFLGLYTDDTTIPSPIKISNPYVLQFDIKYILQTKILQITPLENGVELTTNLPEFKKILVEKSTPVLTEWEEGSFNKADYQTLRVNQNVKISVDYMLRSGRYKLISILVDRN